MQGELDLFCSSSVFQRLTPRQRCKTRNIECVETEERQQQERRVSVARDANQNGSVGAPSLAESTMSNPKQAPESTNHVAAVDNAPSMNDGLNGLSGMDATGNLGPMAFESVFPEFFEHIMMPFGGNSSTDNVVRPPDVSNYTQDLNFGAADLDFSFLDNPAAWTPMPFQEMQMDAPDTQQTNTGRTPSSEAGPRSEALKRSPWSWNSWIPPRGVGAFSEHDELNVREDRVNAADQLTSPSSRQISHCSLEQRDRDQMIRIVTKCTVHKL